jgi:hypothetical protein
LNDRDNLVREFREGAWAMIYGRRTKAIEFVEDIVYGGVGYEVVCLVVFGG